MAGHVYLIGSHLFNWYKIGLSKNASIRVSELGILLPFRVEVIAVWKATDHYKLEKELHERFEKHKINGEWFLFKGQELPKVIAEINAMGFDYAQVKQTFANIEKDSIQHLKQYFASEKGRKHISRLTARACKAEERVAELESLLQSLNVEKVLGS
jgi:hypothetical protein